MSCGGGEPILKKIGLILKVRNGVSNTRMLLDTKQSGVKRITGKYQRVVLPRIFDAILCLLLLFPQVRQVVESISAFVLDFNEAFWQVPIRPDEGRYFCATAIFRGKRRWLAYLRVAQGSANAPLLWARLAATIMRLTQ